MGQKLSQYPHPHKNDYRKIQRNLTNLHHLSLGGTIGTVPHLQTSGVIRADLNPALTDLLPPPSLLPEAPKPTLSESGS